MGLAILDAVIEKVADFGGRLECFLIKFRAIGANEYEAKKVAGPFDEFVLIVMRTTEIVHEPTGRDTFCEVGNEIDLRLPCSHQFFGPGGDKALNVGEIIASYDRAHVGDILLVIGAILHPEEKVPLVSRDLAHFLFVGHEEDFVAGENFFNIVEAFGVDEGERSFGFCSEWSVHRSNC